MKFLIDSCLPKDFLVPTSHQTVHVSDIWPAGDPGDAAIIKYAAENEFVIVTTDSDFEAREVRQFHKRHSGILRVAKSLAECEAQTSGHRTLSPLFPYLKSKHIVSVDHQYAAIKPGRARSRKNTRKPILIDSSIDIRNFNHKKGGLVRAESYEIDSIIAEAIEHNCHIASTNKAFIRALTKIKGPRPGMILLPPGPGRQRFIKDLENGKIRLPDPGAIMIQGDNWSSWLRSAWQSVPVKSARKLTPS